MDHTHFTTKSLPQIVLFVSMALFEGIGSLQLPKIIWHHLKRTGFISKGVTANALCKK